MKAAIELHKVSKTYPGKKALDRLSLSIPAGSIFALLGDNGAGKSTAIRILNGLTPPDSGFARILGQDVWNDASLLRQRILRCAAIRHRLLGIFVGELLE